MIDILLAVILNLSELRSEANQHSVSNTECAIEKVQMPLSTFHSGGGLNPKFVGKAARPKYPKYRKMWKGKDRSRKNYSGGRSLNRMK